jgi:hypothetical protein
VVFLSYRTHSCNYLECGLHITILMLYVIIPSNVSRICSMNIHVGDELCTLCFMKVLMLYCTNVIFINYILSMTKFIFPTYLIHTFSIPLKNSSPQRHMNSRNLVLLVKIVPMFKVRPCLSMLVCERIESFLSPPFLLLLRSSGTLYEVCNSLEKFQICITKNIIRKTNILYN